MRENANKILTRAKNRDLYFKQSSGFFIAALCIFNLLTKYFNFCLSFNFYVYVLYLSLSAMVLFSPRGSARSVPSL